MDLEQLEAELERMKRIIKRIAGEGVQVLNEL